MPAYEYTADTPLDDYQLTDKQPPYKKPSGYMKPLPLEKAIKLQQQLNKPMMPIKNIIQKDVKS
jgi:hypothetical protein